jgi:hypothetical protein
MGDLWLKAGFSESEEETNGRLSEVSKFIQIEAAHTEIGNFVNQASILGANPEIIGDIEISSSAVHESASCLAFRSVDEVPVGRIEHECSTAGAGVRPEAACINWNVCHESARHLMKIAFNR